MAQRFPIYSLPHICRMPFSLSTFPTTVVLATTNEPTLTHHPPSPVYIRVQSCCCTFCGFAPIDNDSVLKIKLLIRISALKKSSVLCLFIPPPSPNLWQSTDLLLSVVLSWIFFFLLVLYYCTLDSFCQPVF